MNKLISCVVLIQNGRLEGALM